VADHPFMVGSQFHPEFQSRPNKAHPLFKAFIQAAAAFQVMREAGNAPIPIPISSDEQSAA
jgi:CTP synthase